MKLEANFPREVQEVECRVEIYKFGLVLFIAVVWYRMNEDIRKAIPQIDVAKVINTICDLHSVFNHKSLWPAERISVNIYFHPLV